MGDMPGTSEGIIAEFSNLIPGEERLENAYLSLTTRLEGVNPALKLFFDDEIKREISDRQYQNIFPKNPSSRDIADLEGEAAARYLRSDDPEFALRSLQVRAGQCVRRYTDDLNTTPGSMEIQEKLQHAQTAYDVLNRALPPRPSSTKK